MKLDFEDYIVIPAFVVIPITEGGLGLKGNEAIVYSIIYGFSKDGDSWYQGSQSYLAAWCGGTRQGVQKNLNSLLEKGLIKREYVTKNGNTYVNYQSCHPANSVGGGGEQSLHHNIEHNNQCCYRVVRNIGRDSRNEPGSNGIDHDDCGECQQSQH